MQMKNSRIRDLIYAALSAAFIAVCSWIAIPGAIPFTMQSFGVLTVSGLFGGKRGFLAVLVYILLGAVGIPVFSAGRGGIGVLLGETGGYLMGFLVGAFVCGIICRKTKSTAGMFLAMLVCMVICYITGCLWGTVVYTDGKTAGIFLILSRYVIPFVIPDLAKLVLAVFAVRALQKRKVFY